MTTNPYPTLRFFEVVPLLALPPPRAPRFPRGFEGAFLAFLEVSWRELPFAEAPVDDFADVAAAFSAGLDLEVDLPSSGAGFAFAIDLGLGLGLGLGFFCVVLASSEVAAS